MTVNAWINNLGIQSEQDLVESLKIEAIQMKGMDLRYCVRDMDNRDYLFSESTVSSFEKSGVVEMYFEQMSNFAGDADLFAKFGIESADEATFLVSTKRFIEELGQFGLTRPREGDLIYVSLSNALFEVKNVLTDENFYQLGKNYTWRMKCKLFEYGQETIATGDPATDAFNDIGSIELSHEQNASLGRVLGLTTNVEESPEIQEEVRDILTFDPNNPFGE